MCDSNFGPTNSRRFGQNNGFKMVRGLKFHCSQIEKTAVEDGRDKLVTDLTYLEEERWAKIELNEVLQ
jgi:hypothetical protein